MKTKSKHTTGVLRRQHTGRDLILAALGIAFGLLITNTFAQSTHESNAYNKNGGSFGNNGRSGDPGSGTPSTPEGFETMQVAFEIRSEGKQLKNSCAACHWLEVKIDGKSYSTGEAITLPKGTAFDITVDDIPKPLPPNTQIPKESPKDYTGNFTVYPIPVDGQTITEIPGETNQPPKAFIAKKDEVFQYLIENSEGLLVRDKKWPENESESPVKKKARITPLEIAVDANRDGVISMQSDANSSKPIDTTSQERPFRFWLNDDNDGLPNSEGEAIGTGMPDYDDGVIQTARDLEDFARMHIEVGALPRILGGTSSRIELRFKNTAGTSPRIKVYKAHDPSGSDSYLKSDTAAFAQISGDEAYSLGEVSESDALVIPADLFVSNNQDSSKVCLLFEGSSEGVGQLYVRIYDQNGTMSAEGGSVWLNLKNIKTMYQSSEEDEFEQPSDEASQTVVFVHGWNMSPEGSRNYAETMFKRLWHRGFKGRFAYFRWNTYWITATDYVETLTTQYFANYNNSEYIAWTQGAPALKSFVERLPYESKNIAAHSMGNVVVGEAMRLGMRVDNYALMQPAVPASCYDDREALKQTDNYLRYIKVQILRVTFEKAVTMWDEASPDDDPDVTTRNMSYRGMLKDIARNGNLILFYLPNDSATSNAWEINNDLTKPSGFLSGQFRYDRNAETGKKLYRDFGDGLFEYSWSNRRESASLACRSWGKAAGAERRTEGAISTADRVNLGDSGFQLPGEVFSGFGDEHGGQFTAQIQQLRPFYDELINRLEVGPTNP